MKAGVAKVTITPNEPLWLAGWAARRQPANGKAMDLFAKALALEDARGRRIVIVTMDLIAIPRHLALRVRERCGLPPESILLNVSHTHSGPEIRPDKVPFFEIPSEFAAKIPAYVRELEDKLVAVIGNALKTLAPAVVQICQTSVVFARNRRSENGQVDHQVPILNILVPDGKPLAIVFGYACHNLTLPPTFCQYHGDYAGLAQEMLEQRIPGTTALFLTGAGADQDPYPRGTPELAISHAETLAAAVARMTSQGTTIDNFIDTAFEETQLDFMPVPDQATLESEVQSNDPPRSRKASFLLAQNVPAAWYPCPVQAVRLGSQLLLIALGGEPVVEYSLRLREKLRWPNVWVAGYSNDMFGYLPSRRVLAEGGYEGGRALLWSALPAPFAGAAEDRIMAAVERLAARLGVPYTDPP